MSRFDQGLLGLPEELREVLDKAILASSPPADVKLLSGPARSREVTMTEGAEDEAAGLTRKVKFRPVKYFFIFNSNLKVIFIQDLVDSFQFHNSVNEVNLPARKT